MISTFFRLFIIVAILLRYGIDGEINARKLPWYLRILAYLCPGRYLFKRHTRGDRLRQALEELGPVFVKFGQLLSTRPDLLPADVFNALRLLQDKVKPFSAEEARQILNASYSVPLNELFAEFSAQPLASASIAQVHAATLHNGDNVVIKILRPGIERVIARDLKCLAFFATLFEHLHPDGRRIHPIAIVEDYAFIIRNELDFEYEAANSTLLREHFKHSPDLYVPTVYWDYSCKQVLCMERIYGIPVGDIDALKKAGIDFKQLSERAMRIFFTQLLEHNFFHADMHPGNIFIDVSQPRNAKFIALDCAIMGSIDEQEKLTLARLLNAIFKRDYQLAAELFVLSGWVSADTAVSELAGAIRASNEPVFAKPISEISFAEQLLALFNTGRRFDMQVQPSLFLLQKTLFNIEGLGKQLYPQLDLWQTAQPFIERWLKQHYSPLNMLRRTRQHLPMFLDRAPQMINNALLKNTQEKHSPNQPPPAPAAGRRLLAAALTGSLLSISIFSPTLLSSVHPAGWFLSGIMLSWLWFK